MKDSVLGKHDNMETNWSFLFISRFFHECSVGIAKIKINLPSNQDTVLLDPLTTKNIFSHRINGSFPYCMLLKTEVVSLTRGTRASTAFQHRTLL